MIRILFILLILLLSPFILMIIGLIILLLYIFLKLKIIKSNFIFNNFQQMRDKFAFSDQNSDSAPHNPYKKKSFFETALRQVSCKHQNLEQKNKALFCSDCGKIVSNA